MSLLNSQILLFSFSDFLSILAASKWTNVAQWINLLWNPFFKHSLNTCKAVPLHMHNSFSEYRYMTNLHYNKDISRVNFTTKKICSLSVRCIKDANGIQAYFFRKPENGVVHLFHELHVLHSAVTCSINQYFYLQESNKYVWC